ncbi:Nn.00g012590.m01.CDS01 [Neocucurbitaria sp. VM-36]
MVPRTEPEAPEKASGVDLTSLFPAFEHEPLPSPTSIRLATFDDSFSSTGNSILVDGQPLLHYKLVTVDLKDKPAFDALSYTWGSPFQSTPIPSIRNLSKAQLEAQYSSQKRHPIIINGHIHHINRNLHEALLRLSASVTNPDFGVDRRYAKYRKTRLLEAAEEGDTTDVLRLIREGADINAQDAFGETPLHYATERQHIDVVRVLLRAGADPEVKNKRGMTILDRAEGISEEGHDAGRQLIEMIKSPPPVEKIQIQEQRHRALWIDQIAIDQTNVAERNAQVAIMGDIFATAETVVVWLGVADQFTDHARWLMYVG